ncbi:RcpC/CpaB family pilus assembly protein [Vibrio hippocampi]|uniref:Flp pilus assembly protein RcpC/CpaB domain-containing protein n=1 Tax=Vibrio hippocampi TaxID=654686 RepID=A0ABN8DRR0_9VIBR|nr:RcpC/CpaB family pilus assembly protein [Vibrio hippocampi]CAH0529692.1 hypothetical protein VHP8226_03447 [Vibrio hippocampi]
MRSRIVLVVALLALGIGVKGVLDLLAQPNNTNVAVNNEQKEPETYITVWQLNQNVKKGQVLNIDMVEKRQLPLNQALELGEKKDIVLDFDPSTLINISLDKGRYMLPEYQTKKSQPGYVDLLVTEGMTLYPLQVTTSNLVKDYIRPGSFIDILTVSSPNSNLAVNADKPKRFRGIKSSVFLKHVKVLNIGNETENESIQARSPVKEEGKTTVVIEVHPDQLTKLALAQRTMHIEIYRSQTYQQPTYAEVRNIMDNYMGIEELRGGVDSEGESL